MLFRQTGLICEDALVQNDMNDVLNLKLGTSEVDYPSDTWADNVAILDKPLPSKTASGAIAHFTDGADSVPLNSGLFYFNPVQNGTPTPSSPIAIYGHTGLNIYKAKKNFFTSENEQTPAYINSSGTIQTGGGASGWALSDYIVVVSGATYYFNPNTTGGSTAKHAYFDSSKSFVSSINSGEGSFTVPNGIKYMRFSYRTTSTDIQLEVGNSATEYTPYVAPTTYPVSWTSHGTIYGGYYNSKTGELWKNTYKVEPNEDFTYQIDSQTSSICVCYFAFSTNSLPTGKNGGVCLSTRFSKTTPSGTAGRMVLTGSQIYLVLPKAEDTTWTTTEVKQWFEDNATEIVYELATPVLVAVIDPTKIKTFEGINNIWNDGGGISEVGYRSKASSGGGIPTFTETILAEDTNSTGTLDFDGADYHDYELIKCYLKNTSTLREFEVLMTPQCLDDIFQYFGNGICFNQFGSNIFAYYDTNASGNWIKGSSDRLICTKVCGLTGQGFSINVTNLYRKQAVQSTAQAITTQLDLNDFDCIIASANNNTSDCVPCCYVMSGIVHNESLRNQMPNMANAWANSQEIDITDHEISSYNWFCVDAVKFE